MTSGSAEGVERLTILGATGSIGLSTLDLVRRHPNRFQIEALTAHTRVAELAGLAREFRPNYVAIGDETRLEDLRAALTGTGIACGAGPEALIEAAARPSDRVMASIVGAAGLRPTLAAVRRGATVLLANKECLVCAGDLMLEVAAKAGATILPVDSEHNAIYQVFDAKASACVERLILTASGGPFRGQHLGTLKAVTPAEAVAHPNWDMGAKISVDSATLMNKGLEVIEAYYLFPVKKEQIEVVVHPQSVIHSMVEYADGSVLAQLGSADMRVPIAYCMGWPDRLATPAERLDFTALSRLDFEAPDLETFACLKLAREALEAGGTAPLVLNAANEVAVASFLAGHIGFLDIAALVGATLEVAADTIPPQSIASVLEADTQARTVAHRLISERF